MPTSPTARQTWRTVRAPVLALAFVLIVFAVVAISQRVGSETSLDPDSAAPQGSRALAELLRGEGVQVDRVIDVAALSTAAADTTVVLTGLELLDEDAVGALARLPGSADVVAVAPDDAVLAELAPAASSRSPVNVEPRDPACPLPAAVTAGPATIGGLRFGASSGNAALACYSVRGSGTLLQLPRSEGATTTFLGTGAPMTNAELDEQGNAALTLGLLGTGQRVLWLVPEPALGAADGEQQSLGELLPDGLRAALLQLLIAGVVLILWRVRRLGPVVAEPLPVVVRAAETVEGRARLYRSTRARDRVADALRGGARSRLAPLVGLPGDTDARALVDAVALQTGRVPGDVGGLLYGAVPADDTSLVRLATDLDDLDAQVRRG